MRDRKGLSPDGRESGKKVGGIDGEETITKIYYVRKKFIFIKMKNKSMKQHDI